MIEDGEIQEVCPYGYCSDKPNNEVTDSSDSDNDMNSENLNMSSDNELDLTTECQVRQIVSESMNADIIQKMHETFTSFRLVHLKLTIYYVM